MGRSTKHTGIWLERSTIEQVLVTSMHSRILSHRLRLFLVNLTARKQNEGISELLIRLDKYFIRLSNINERILCSMSISEAIETQRRTLHLQQIN